MLDRNESGQFPGNTKPTGHRDENGVRGGHPREDEIVSPSLVQNTYARIKSIYADDLRTRWIEETEFFKYVFGDLMMASFLIELWRGMYGVAPGSENSLQSPMDGDPFPGFVDIACGSGVLVYVLLMEGYQGCGFDADRRKTWGIFPGWVQAKLMQRYLVPQPFADAVGVEDMGNRFHTGKFPDDTFIISNHADELTVWTPLMAALACPTSPLPFLVIPCCSHSLTGNPYRYPSPKSEEGNMFKGNAGKGNESIEQNPQPAAGDLKALRAAKNHEKSEEDLLSSTYGSLTAKVMEIAAEIGYDVEKIQVPILSLRNTGVLGNRQRVANQWKRRPKYPSLTSTATDHDEGKGKELSRKILDIVDRECAREGGRQASAQTWVMRAR